MPYAKAVFARLPPLLLGLALACPAAAARLTVTDAASGAPLEEAVIEVYAPGHRVPAAHSRVIQRDATFIPHVTVVPVGGRVSFPNRDTSRHHVFSFSPAKVFDLELYLQDTPPPVRFGTPGVVVLGCNIHDHMQAFIVVSEAPLVAVTGPDGEATLPELPSGRHVVRVWHPRLDDTHQRWWEGRIAAGDSLRVPLELRATLPPPPEPSALQKRFQQALQDRRES